MTDIWENTFIERQEMWGLEPTESAIMANNFFKKQHIKNVLIPGIGYGRNAKLFIDNDIKVTGIEISQTAIRLAEKHYGSEMKIYHGSVTDMPFDTMLYDGIFCYGLAYLLDFEDRKKLIRNCYNQLQNGGYMIFSIISIHSPNYGMGKQIGENHFEIQGGVKLFFYNKEAIQNEFGDYGLTEYIEIDEPVKKGLSSPPFKFWFLKCHKEP